MDVVVTLTIPEAQVPRAIEAFNGIAGARIDMNAHNPETNFNGNWNFTIDPKGAGESQLDFGKRVFKSLGLALIRLWDYAEDQDRYRTAVNAIPTASQDVPDGILA